MLLVAIFLAAGGKENANGKDNDDGGNYNKGAAEIHGLISCS
jgi:hypothetical protein